MGAVLSIPGQFWGRKRKKKGTRELLAAAWAMPLLQEGQSCWKRMERGWMRPPAPSAPAHPSPQQRLGAWREPFGDFFVCRVLGGAPLFHARGLMQWGPEVLGWCRAKLRRVTARRGHHSLPPVCDACPSPCPQLGGVPKPPSPRLSSAGRPLPASSVGRVGFPSCAIRRPAGSQERSEPATALAPSPLCSPEGVRGGGGTRQGWVLSPAVPPQPIWALGCVLAGGKLRQGTGRKTHPGATPEPCTASGWAGCPRG